MFIARLKGEADGHVETKHFEAKGDAIRWLKGAGLAEYGDQPATGEILDGGNVVWSQSTLQSPDMREREIRRASHKFLSALNMKLWFR